MKNALFIVEQPRTRALPNGALTEVMSVSCLQRTITRCKGIKTAGSVNFVMSEDPYSRAVARRAHSNGVQVMREQGDDRLESICNAAREIQAELVIIVGSSSLFLDAGVVDELVEMVTSYGVDYGSMDMPPSWPHGLDVEVISVRRLRQASLAAHDPKDRDDPTRWVRRNPVIRKANFTGPGKGLESLRWLLETEADLVFLETLYREIGPRVSRFSTAELYGLMLRRPDLAKLSRQQTETRHLNEPILVDVPSQPYALKPAA